MDQLVNMVDLKMVSWLAGFAYFSIWGDICKK